MSRKHQIGLQLRDEFQRFDAVGSLAGNCNIAQLLQQEAEFVTGRSLVVDNQRSYGHRIDLRPRLAVEH